ncbi:MAG: polynucleotide adenylyltransferase PcnB [Chlamydia sp.]
MHPRIYTQKEHGIQKNAIDKDALFAVLELKRHGHIAYIVGGSLRDLLLGHIPKDFDISTSAKPEEIKKIFQRRCLIIGKRFRLAHVRFGDNIIETSTFRSGDTEDDGLITRDNSWGTEEEDVVRRDFTINALFYDPEQELLIDYVDGVIDIEKNLLRTIGDPIVRFRQDPVRMIRMLKFLARFKLYPHEATENALHQVRDEIMKSAPARIYEEIMKMMESGSSRAFFELLARYGFLELLLPLQAQHLDGAEGSLMLTYLQAIDNMIASGHKAHFDRSTSLAAFLFPLFENTILEATREQKHALRMGHVIHLIDLSLQEFVRGTFPHFPKKVLTQVSTLLIHQFRLTPLKGSPKFSLHFPSKEEFKNALCLLSLRASIDHELIPLWNAWKHEYESRSHKGVQNSSEHVIEQMTTALPQRRRKKRQYTRSYVKDQIHE